MKKKINIALIILLFIVSNIKLLSGFGVPAGTVISNIITYGKIGSAELPGELIGNYTNKLGFTNYVGLSNICKVTVAAGHDISVIPPYTSYTAGRGTSVNYIYNITNNGNTSDIFYVNIKFDSTDATDWITNVFSVYKDTTLIADYVTNLTTSFTLASGEVLNLRIQHHIPEYVAIGSTNRIEFEIFNIAGFTNGDNWPGEGAKFIIASNVVDTNNTRDYQISYLTTTAAGIYHIVEVTSAEDLIHTIYKFDGTEYLADTRIKINIRVDSPPLNPDNFYLIYNINKNPTGTRSDDIKIKLSGEGIYWYAIIEPKDDTRIKPGVKFNFIITMDSEVYYKDGRDGDTPWSFNIRSIIRQKNDVTILCNLLNPEKGEKAILFYSLEEPTEVDIEVYTLSGERIITLFKGRQEPGERPVYWDGRNEYGKIVGEGLYFISFRTPKINEIRKVIVVK